MLKLLCFKENSSNIYIYRERVLGITVKGLFYFILDIEYQICRKINFQFRFSNKLKSV